MKEYLKKHQSVICIAAAVCLLGAAAFCIFRISHHDAQVDEQAENFKQLAQIVEQAPESEPVPTVLSCKLDAPAPCRLDAPDFSFVC